MAQGSESDDKIYTRCPSSDLKQDPSDDVTKVLRREKNRVAAQRSRMRQTERADSLHMESEKLERENAALRREVMQLTEEAKYLSAMLSHHEAQCSMSQHSLHRRGLHLPFVAPPFYHL
ncbi:basic leucine zipper transcriptional factor ATF-like [Arapaima gigas]